MPQIGGNNLWRLIRRFQIILKLPLVGRDRLSKILQENGLKVRWPKSRIVKTTYSGHSYAVQPNLAREYQATKPNQLWVADITHIRIEGSKAFLFLITDKYSRKIVGFHLARTLHADGAVKALQVALDTHQYPVGVIHHTDRGVQYCCHEFLDEIRKWELRSSMTDADHCAQNALAECMNGILKREFLLGLGFSSFDEALETINETILTYNKFRIHGSLNGKTPSEVHDNSSGIMELWAKEIVAFFAPLPKFNYFGVNSI
jgi:putative transposase